MCPVFFTCYICPALLICFYNNICTNRNSILSLITRSILSILGSQASNEWAHLFFVGVLSTSYLGRGAFGENSVVFRSGSDAFMLIQYTSVSNLYSEPIFKKMCGKSHYIL